ncbi:FG-GAP-like repeat-containing protein [Streptomyces sp. TX20-6-3]|uniref:FG-GAP-like repeat-containing protein n=1 Tax=Streptomyces sp. TX20-6-3 TaxID=3028705 RepID=UPI0029A20695|nr:FG-GAP-like repeat-containing protein [Streptomyces sp. TX20-6-3]MDX2559543.1 FG-GAP-like repeat-containing protein [Streptomyces sp. TX20-6-3]
MTRTSGIRRAVAAAVTTAATLATMLASAPAASADEYRCPAGSFCVFQYPRFGGQMKIVSASQPTLGTWNNTISSYINRSNRWAVAHQDAHYGGNNSLVIGPRQPVGSDLSWESWSELDNSISSIRMADTQWEAETGQAWIDWDTSTTPRPDGLPAQSRFGDLDNDGTADLLERDGAGRLWFLDGVRDADGRTKGVLVGGGWGAMNALVRHGDHDGDGNEDVYARDRAGVLWLYPGNGKGWFKPRLKIGGGWNTMKEIEAVGDITGDGRRDLVARDTAGVLWTYPGNGRGWFGARTKVGGGWGAMNALAAPGDMNRDGRSDLVARDGSRALWLYPGNGRGAFGARVRLPYAWPSDTLLIATGDVTGDGLGDIIRTIESSSLYVYANNGSGGLRTPEFETGYDTTSDSVHVF